MLSQNFTGIVAMALLLSAGLTAVFFGMVYSLKRQFYLGLWAGAWTLVALHYAARAFDFLASQRWYAPVNEWFLAAAGLVFWAAAELYSQLRPKWWLLGVLAGVFAAWSALFYFSVISVPPLLATGLIFAYVGWVFWRESRKQEAVADRLLSAAFITWAAMLWSAMNRQWLGSPAPLAWIFVIIPQLFVAVLMVMALYEEEKRRVERNMLALSNLNLATSSFMGGEIQKMLAQALERVLSVVRIPSGALFLKHADAQGQSTVVFSGMSEGFCAAAEKEKLDDHLIQMVARLGGLIVFRDLARPAFWADLEREDAFRRFREVAVGEGLHTVVGISLQAKERVFGVLLLATPDNRRFTPAELRLLLALGHQIGMAVENSYLIQQTSRRTEELHILNEIGRALSAKLEVDQLFETIFAELQRLFDVSSFYIALYDPQRDEIRFELEIISNVRLAKRRRPAGNHLTEYMIRSRQPVLIRDRFGDETKKLGVEPLQQTGCFAGVPLVLYDRAIGAMAVHSTHENVFDEGHLELMRVLASQAGIAIENARLFSEEQKKSRQLALLNNVSRHAITTLNQDEMLAKIAQEIEQALTYDHLGIGILDYSSKEIVIQAEGGRRREALGRRIPLGEGLAGQVARSGQMAAVRDARGNESRLLLPDSLSAIALPIVYADLLIGVLYVETSQVWDFTEGETLLLRTLADQVAGALHNAMTFQKAQEQAITDGLTGVKTHRFFMEALSAEWKRSTRAGRPFSLVLMDLDRFKFVNDFFGHLAGDTVLQRIGQILEQNCRRSDVISRYGGDEFVILMPETTMDQAVQIAGKLRAWVEADAYLHEKNVTASFGIAAFPLHGSTPQELIQVADSSMYLSKHNGGNAVSTPENLDSTEAKKWKQDVLEAYLGVTLKRLFVTGPETFDDIYRRLEQFTQSLEANAEAGSNGSGQLAPVVIETLTSLALAIDAKDHYTQGHSQKVSGFAQMLTLALVETGTMRLTEAEVEAIRLAALLHDVGKVGIPEAILNKRGPLDGDEWEIMKTHAALGARLLEPLRVAAPLQEIIRHHHEFFDGSGYPDQLTGMRIPFGARIVAICDAFDTILSDRAYKKARGIEDALAELERCRGAQFDPDLVNVFVKAMRVRAMSALPVGNAEPENVSGSLRN